MSIVLRRSPAHAGTIFFRSSPTINHYFHASLRYRLFDRCPHRGHSRIRGHRGHSRYDRQSLFCDLFDLRSSVIRSPSLGRTGEFTFVGDSRIAVAPCQWWVQPRSWEALVQKCVRPESCEAQRHSRPVRTEGRLPRSSLRLDGSPPPFCLSFPVKRAITGRSTGRYIFVILQYICGRRLCSLECARL